MKDTDRVELTVGAVKRAAGKCETAKEVLKTLCPEVFKESPPEWEDVTNQYRAENGDMDDRNGLFLTDGKHYPIMVEAVYYPTRSALHGLVKVEGGRIWKKREA